MSLVIQKGNWNRLSILQLILQNHMEKAFKELGTKEENRELAAVVSLIQKENSLVFTKMV